jgi:hypothetical protein
MCVHKLACIVWRYVGPQNIETSFLDPTWICEGMLYYSRKSIWYLANQGILREFFEGTLGSSLKGRVFFRDTPKVQRSRKKYVFL